MTRDDDLAPTLPPVAPAPARRGRPKKTKAAGAGETRDAILNAAEDLFSKHGFYGVTIREVAREAGVDTALVHYYFGAKKALFDAVFIRRAEVWNSERVAAVDRYAEAAGEAMTLEGLFEAFLRPPFQWSLKGGPGWKHYAALVAQTNANPAFGGETMARYFDPAIIRLLELVRRLLPQARDEDLYWAWHNLSGALTLTLGETGRLDRLSGGLCKSGDLDSACDYMVRFAAAGFRAVCAPKQSG
ncbi:TetR/AcrR family transcriptional regulator [Brevundimonas sp. P7753]|jgi:AcrR family transcriptional regulator|uniref:TetR/AcrR family transcriptional regulator n=1 Tax=Brevundimonas sp. P7753 TaxID=2726982 RepID=UPI0015BD44DE|nr:TetR/AcrR family transcriptional regulator [Brevundimonas sp. P7753]NWE51693.1 TetR/AcrR family transcriptional regulator [Brevundimonas sp. P7753]